MLDIQAMSLAKNKRCTKDHQSIFAYFCDAADKFESFRTYLGFRLIQPNQQEVLVKDQQHNASGQPLPGQALHDLMRFATCQDVWTVQLSHTWYGK